MLWLAFGTVGSVCLLFCLRKLFVFALQALLPLRPCPFWLSDFFSIHSFRWAGWRWAVSGCPCVASRGFSSPPARLGPAGGVEEPLVARSVHAGSLLSPQFIRGLGIQELLSCGGLLLPVLSWLVLPSHLCTLGKVMERESLRGFFSVLGCLSRLISGIAIIDQFRLGKVVYC